MTTTENQKIILYALIQNHIPLTETYLAALADAYKDGIDEGIKICEQIITKNLKGGD